MSDVSGIGGVGGSGGIGAIEGRWGEVVAGQGVPGASRNGGTPAGTGFSAIVGRVRRGEAGAPTGRGPVSASSGAPTGQGPISAGPGASPGGPTRQGPVSAGPGASSGAGTGAARQTRLKEACQELESVLWSFMFRQMHEGISTGKGLFDDGSAAKGFRDMLDGERGKEMVRSGGSGLADVLYRELSRKENGTDKPR